MTFSLFSSYSHLLLKQLTELERGGHIKHGGDVNTTSGVRKEGGVIDASLRGIHDVPCSTIPCHVLILCSLIQWVLIHLMRDVYHKMRELGMVSYYIIILLLYMYTYA